MKDSDILRRIRRGSCSVLGYGVSNRPLVEWLVAHGAGQVTVRDERPLSVLTSPQREQLYAWGVTYIGGPDYLEGLAQEAQRCGDAVIFRTPGIRPDKPPIAAAVAAGALLSSEMELFFELTEATVLGITGSDGKTTSTTLTSHLIAESLAARGHGHMYLGGNIGTPLLPMAEQMTPADVAVVELSSFQLMTLQRAPFRAAVTNLAENHLNWHTDMQEYVTAKANLLRYAPAGGGVLNRENDLTLSLGLSLPDDMPLTWFSSERCGWAQVVPAVRVQKGCPDVALYEQDGYIVRATQENVRPLLEVARIRLPGRHNLENYMTALAMADGWLTPEIAGRVADEFCGVPHRLELVRERNGIRYYNSSIDSSPTRTRAALEALKDMNRRALAAGGSVRRAPIVICGGRDKHLDMEPLAEALCRGASAVVLTGEARELILAALQACPQFDAGRLPVTVIADWTEAMTTACRMAAPGDTVLLSPACTSFDAFRNFEERGQLFRSIVRDEGNGGDEGNDPGDS